MPTRIPGNLGYPEAPRQKNGSGSGCQNLKKNRISKHSFSSPFFSLYSLPYPPFHLLPLPTLLNVFFLNLSCVYSFCFVLLNFTCLSSSVCRCFFSLKNFQTYNKALYYTEPVTGPGGVWSRVSGSKTAPAVPYWKCHNGIVGDGCHILQWQQGHSQK